MSGTTGSKFSVNEIDLAAGPLFQSVYNQSQLIDYANSVAAVRETQGREVAQSASIEYLDDGLDAPVRNNPAWSETDRLALIDERARSGSHIAAAMIVDGARDLDWLYTDYRYGKPLTEHEQGKFKNAEDFEGWVLFNEEAKDLASTNKFTFSACCSAINLGLQLKGCLPIPEDVLRINLVGQIGEKSAEGKVLKEEIHPKPGLIKEYFSKSMGVMDDIYPSELDDYEVMSPC